MTPVVATSILARRPWPWAVLAVAMVAIRWPLWRLPGPGRDEAAYHYWAHHPEFSYAPLLQLAVRLSEMISGPHSLWGLRAPVVLLGGLVLLINDRRLRNARTDHSGRWLAAAAVALTPWQSFAGSILHPDLFLLAALLGTVWAHQRGHLWWLVTAAVTAVLAKPTGVLCLPVVWMLVGRTPDTSARQRGIARTILVLVLLAITATLRPGMLAAMANFGRLAPETGVVARGLTVTTTLLFNGGPLLLALAVVGARQRWRRLQAENPDTAAHREAVASLALGAVLVAVFLAAALLRGQFKGNWILPVGVLLWPLAWTGGATARRFVTAGLLISTIASAGQTLAMVRPELINRLESWAATNQTAPDWLAYNRTAGVREARVSASRSWTDHLRQYRDATSFAQAVQTSWDNAQPAPGPMRWIVSDDYGLACQLHWYLGRPDTRVAIANDGIFATTWQALVKAAPTTPLLQISGTHAKNPLSSHLASQTILPVVAHPETGQLWQPVVSTWLPMPNQE